jgi:hypothetical protein
VTAVIGPALAYLIGIVIADTSPTASMVIYGIVPIVYFLGVTLARSSSPPGVV